MSSPSRPRAWLLALACLTLLFTQMGGAHLHLCFDGQEPPASLHLSDANHHDDHHGGHHDRHHAAGETPHSDLDVPLANDVLSKPVKPILDLSLILLAVLWLGALSFTRDRIPPPDPTRLRAFSTFLLLPPLRGPPLQAS